jgi:hypothetical protein
MGSCDDGNEPTGYIKGGEFSDHVQQLIIETMLMVVKIVMLIDDGGDV